MIRTLKLIVLVIVAACSCSKVMDEDRGYVEIGSELPSFTVRMDDGTFLMNTDLRDTVSIICFFNTACGDCRTELPVLQEVFNKKECMMVMISREEGDETIRNYWSSQMYTMPFSAQPDRKVYSLFAQSRIPRIYVANRNAVVCAIHDDIDMPTADELLEELKMLRLSSNVSYDY